MDDIRIKYRKVRLIDIMVLLYHLHKGARDPQIGYEDATETLDSMTKKLNRELYFEDKDLESCLFNANLMAEKGDFWHPFDISFDEFVKRFLHKGEKYNKFFGTIDKK